MDEKELVIRAKKGDIDAFCILYDNYIRKLFNYAYYKLGNSEDAEDVVQDCMLTAFEQLGKLKNPKAFSSWLFNACLSSSRSTSTVLLYENAFA